MPRSYEQFFNVFNHPNFALPTNTLAGIPGWPLNAHWVWRPYLHDGHTGLLGVGLGGDNSPRMIAFEAQLEFLGVIAGKACSWTEGPIIGHSTVQEAAVTE